MEVVSEFPEIYEFTINTALNCVLTNRNEVSSILEQLAVELEQKIVSMKTTIEIPSAFPLPEEFSLLPNNDS
jgi:hypothetical protein